MDSVEKLGRLVSQFLAGAIRHETPRLHSTAFPGIVRQETSIKQDLDDAIDLTLDDAEFGALDQSPVIHEIPGPTPVRTNASRALFSTGSSILGPT